MDIYNLDLSTRTYNCLLRAGIKTVEQLRSLTDSDLYNIKNLNKKGIEEIRHRLSPQKLSEKLEKYEKEAYEAGFGSDWLSDIGEGFKFYIELCSEKNIEPTITGFEAWIDGIHDGRIYGANILK